MLALLPPQADRVANFIRSAVKFRASPLANKLEVEVFHLNPQHSNTQHFRNIVRYTFTWNVVLRKYRIMCNRIRFSRNYVANNVDSSYTSYH